MKKQFSCAHPALKHRLKTLVATVLASLAFTSTSDAQNSSFSYQGRLNSNDLPYTGPVELQFTLWDDLMAGSAVATNSPPSVVTAVSNGLFLVTLDFGTAAFTGSPRWLQIEVRTTLGPFTKLTPRQLVGAVPYSIHSATAANASTLTQPISDSLLSANIARLQSSPVFTGTVNATSFSGSGDMLTGITHLDSVGDGPAGALSVDASGHVAVGTNDSGAALQVTGGTVYLNPDFRTAIVNNSSTGVVHMNYPVSGVAAGTRLYVAAYFPGAVQIFDISNRNQPVWIGEAVDNSVNAGSAFTRLGGANNTFATNNLLFVTAEGENSLTIMDVSNPANPIRLIEIANGVGGVTNMLSPTCVAVSGNYAYVCAFNSSSISVFDVSTPTSPVLMKQILDDSVQPASPFTRLQSPYQLQIVGNKLYVAARGDHALNIIDISNPTNPSLITNIVDASVVPASPFNRLRNANWVDVVGNTAYVAAGASSLQGSLTIIDVSNPANPIKLAEITDSASQTNSPFTKLSGAWAVKVLEGVAFVTATTDNAVTAVDVTSPAQPRLLREFVHGRDLNTLLTPQGITGAGDFIYTFAGNSSAIDVFKVKSQLGLKVDGYVGIGTATPRAALDVNGTVMARTFQWSTSSVLSADQGGSIELGDSTMTGSTPYIDFHYGTGSVQDYNVRLVNVSNQLSVIGNFGVSGNSSVTGNSRFGGNTVVDSLDFNNGTLNYGLTFGGSSGEGIASKRSAGVGQFGLDFYTAFVNRMTIANNGNVGIGTLSPGATLEVRTTSGTGNAIRFGFYTGGEGNLIAGPSRVAIATGDMVERISILQGGGNVGLGTITPAQKLHVVGNIYATGTITPNSDVNEKTDFKPIDASTILDRVLHLDIRQWRFKAEPENVKHVGPMAQDFQAAFGLGEIPTAISTVDADGIALAAIQALNQKLENTLTAKQMEIQDLKRRLEKLEQKIGADGRHTRSNPE